MIELNEVVEILEKKILENNEIIENLKIKNTQNQRFLKKIIISFVINLLIAKEKQEKTIQLMKIMP